MTPKERAAMQQALEALQEYRDTQMIKAPRRAITALREALDHFRDATKMVAEQAEQEPVASSIGAVLMLAEEALVFYDTEELREEALTAIRLEKARGYTSDRYTEGFTDGWVYANKNATPVQKAEQEPSCNQHPDAPHGFARNASHNAGRYVCECEGWEPEQAEQEPVAWMEDSIEFYASDRPSSTFTIPLYAAPVCTKDLTPDELFSIANKVGFDGELMKTNHDRGMPSIAEQYARAVIAADRDKNK